MSPPAKILIVDDEPFNVDYLEQELEDLGYETDSATSGSSESRLSFSIVWGGES